MSRREDIDNAIWSDPDFLVLTPEARLTYIWSWTNPRCGMAGLYKVALSQTALETGLTVETLGEVFAELAVHRFAFYEDGVIFVRTRVKHMRTTSPQIAKSMRSDVQKITDDHPLKTRWIGENGRTPWLLRHLGIDPRWTLGEGSDEGQGVPALAGNEGGSTEGHPTLKGKGNGKGTGKGPLGRGVGRETSRLSDRELEFRAWAAQDFPMVPVELLMLVTSQLREDGIEITNESVRARLSETHPALLGGVAA